MPEKNNEDDKRLIALLSLVGIVNHADSNKQLYKISEENYARLSSLLDSANISEDEKRRIKAKIDPKKGRTKKVQDLSMQATDIGRAKDIMKPSIIEYENRISLKSKVRDYDNSSEQGKRTIEEKI